MRVVAELLVVSVTTMVMLGMVVVSSTVHVTDG